MPNKPDASHPAACLDVAGRFQRGLQALATRPPRPQPFHDLGTLPWADADFSKHFLRTATRRHTHTRREVAFLEQCGLLIPGRRILDLACGGGRHSLAMARRGAMVTGIDVGPAAIATARRRASRAGLAIEFVQGDLRCLDYDAEFDAATFIFGCFTEMPRDQAEAVLQRICRSLQPGGLFVLDVYAPYFFAELDDMQEWWVGQDFIAGRFPQLVLTEYFYDPRHKTYVRRDFIWNSNTGDLHTYGVSGQAYSLTELLAMLETAGFVPRMAVGSWEGETVTADSHLYIIQAQKPQ